MEINALTTQGYKAETKLLEFYSKLTVYSLLYILFSGNYKIAILLAHTMNRRHYCSLITFV